MIAQIQGCIRTLEKIVHNYEGAQFAEQPVKRKTVALVIGHREGSQGAVNRRSGVTEFTYNSMLADDIRVLLPDLDVKVIHRSTYKKLPGLINGYDPDLVISLHCNAFNQQATGTETLYYHKSGSGMRMASILQDKLVDALGLANRGIKPKRSEDRGGYLLRYTDAPCIIAEPFFIDNDADLKAASINRDELIRAYASAISEMAAVI